MKNIYYYLKKHGSQSFKEFPFNEIDSLILCQISYLNIEKLCENPAKQHYFTDLFKIENAVPLSVAVMSSRKNMIMSKMLVNCPRYQNIYFMDFWSDFSDASYKQFFAVTFFIEDFMYVAYRGTDLSITGWHEDFNMVYLNEVPSQKNAVTYLNKMHEMYGRKMYVGGHSKGGNLAIYAAMYCNSEAKEDIMRVYDFDGPGFYKHEIYESDEYKSIRGRLTSVTSSMSIIAVLMYHSDDIEFIKCSGVGILQHEAFNWHIKDETHLERMHDNCYRSKLIDKITKSIIENSTTDERKHLVDILFYIAKDNPKSSLLDIKRHPVKYVAGMVKRRKLLPHDDIKFYKDISKRIRRLASKVLKDSLSEIEFKI